MTKQTEKIMLKEIRSKTDEELTLCKDELSNLYWSINNQDITNFILDLLQMIDDEEYRRVKNRYPY